MKLQTYTDGTCSGVVIIPDSVTTWLRVAPVPASTCFRVVVDVYLATAQTHFEVSPYCATREEALAEFDRIAALIEGKSPAQGWVDGPPPKDGQWYVVLYDRDPGDIRPSVAQWCEGDGAYSDDNEHNYSDETDITHHLPTPIQPPKES